MFKDMAVDVGEISRKALNFQTLHGKEKPRRDRHIKGEPKKPEGEKAYIKGLEIKGRNERDISKYLIKEGIRDYEEGSDSIFYDCYIPSEDEKWSAEWNDQKEPESFSIEERRTPFDPKAELANVLEDKTPEAMDSYKRSILIQSRVIGEIINSLWEEIEIHDRLDINTLKKMVFENSRAARLTPFQHSLFYRALEDFARKHEAIERYTKQYPDPADLYAKCFNIRPQGIVRMVKWPMALIFQCFDPKDYAEAYNLWKRPLTPEKEKKALGSGGVAFSSIYLADLNGVVVAENVSANSRMGEQGPVVANIFTSLEVQRHEKQHQFNKLFLPIENSLDETSAVYYVIDSVGRSERIRKRDGVIFTAEEKSQEVRQRFIHEMVRLKRHALGIDKRVRDEVLAYYTGGYGYRTIEMIIEILTEDPLYDYVKDYEESIKKIPDYVRSMLMKYDYVSVFAENWVDSSSVTDEEVNSYIDKVFRVDYKRDLTNRIEALKKLESKGYSRQEILTLLYQQPISHWIAFARRAPFLK